MATPRWDLPLPTYQKDVNEVSKIYKLAIIEVLGILGGLATKGADKDISRAQMTSVLAQLSVLLGTVDKDAEMWVKVKIREAFAEGQAETLLTIGEAKTLEEARGLVAAASMSALITQSIDVMVADTFEDLLNANNKMKRETIKMVRAVVSEQMKINAAAGMGRNTTRKAIVKSLTKKGVQERWQKEGDIAIIAKNGRQWRMTEYAEMVTRTKMLQAHSEGIRIEALERGIDLAIISSHNAKDACKQFEGMVISMNGTTEGFMTYDELRRSNLIFHPNCRHKITAIRDLDLLPEEVRKKYEDGLKVAKNALSVRKEKK